MEVRTIAVIGAGTAGRTIACAAARGNYRVLLEDVLPTSLRRAEIEMSASLDQEALARVEYASALEEAARQADLVIEAVPDELESKLEIFVLLDKICRPETILALTSASLSITEIAPVTCRPEKCIGMRFSSCGRLELERGPVTEDATVNACSEVGRRMDRTVVFRT